MRRNFLLILVILCLIPFPVFAYTGPDVYSGEPLPFAYGLTPEDVCQVYYSSGCDNSTTGSKPFYQYVPPGGGSTVIHFDCLAQNFTVPSVASYYPPASMKYIGVKCGGSWKQSDSPSDFPWTWNYSHIVGAWDSAFSADFNATPVMGESPLLVSFLDNSTGLAIDSWNWSISPSIGAYFYSPTSEDSLANFVEVGNYTITHCVARSAIGDSDCEVKSDYIWAYNSTSTTTLYVSAINAMTAGVIQYANISLFDVENSSWTNTTPAPTGTAQITTLNGHTVNAYANYPGFADNDKMAIPVANIYDSVLLFPSGWTNVSAGNATLYVYTYDSINHALPIKGAGITVVSATDSSEAYTNNAGMAQFTIRNRTQYLVNAQAIGQGYKTATQTVIYNGDGGGSATITLTFYLDKNYVTVTPTVTYTGSITPTPSQTVDAYPCDAEHPENCQRKQTETANIVIQYGPMLVNLFILATIMGALKMMGFLR